jgi:hypothetical protein
MAGCLVENLAGGFKVESDLIDLAEPTDEATGVFVVGVGLYGVTLPGKCRGMEIDH